MLNNLLTALGLDRRSHRRRLEEDHAYCSYCGHPMLWTKQASGFDTRTGAARQIDVWRCSNRGDRSTVHDADH